MLLQAEQKKRKDEEKGRSTGHFIIRSCSSARLLMPYFPRFVASSKLSHQNGEPQESHQREKHHYTRVSTPNRFYLNENLHRLITFPNLFQEKSPAYLRERSHDRVETRDKQYPFKQPK